MLIAHKLHDDFCSLFISRKKTSRLTTKQDSSVLMSSEGACNHVVSAITSFTTDKQELPSQDDHCLPRHVVKIPCKIMLDLMLEKLTFPKARYDFHTDHRGQVSAIVTIYSSLRMPGNLLRLVKLGGVEAVDSVIAEESAAREAIRFIELWEDVEVEDLHYSELKYVEEIRDDLYKKLEAARKDNVNLQRGLSLATSRMISFFNQILSITCNNHCLGQGDAAKDINARIKQFEEVGNDLGRAGRLLEKELKSLAIFP